MDGEVAAHLRDLAASGRARVEQVFDTPMTAPFTATTGDTLELRLPFPYHYHIETIPYGASVFLETPEGRLPVGETPVLYKVPHVPGGPFIIERQGYMPEQLMPGQEVWNRYVLTLDPLRVE